MIQETALTYPESDQDFKTGNIIKCCEWQQLSEWVTCDLRMGNTFYWIQHTATDLLRVQERAR